MNEEDAETKRALARARMRELYYRDVDAARAKNRKRQAEWKASDPANHEKAIAWVRAWRARRRAAEVASEYGLGSQEEIT